MTDCNGITLRKNDWIRYSSILGNETGKIFIAKIDMIDEKQRRIYATLIKGYDHYATGKPVIFDNKAIELGKPEKMNKTQMMLYILEYN